MWQQARVLQTAPQRLPHSHHRYVPVRPGLPFMMNDLDLHFEIRARESRLTDLRTPGDPHQLCGTASLLCDAVLQQLLTVPSFAVWP